MLPARGRLLAPLLGLTILGVAGSGVSVVAVNGRSAERRPVAGAPASRARVVHHAIHRAGNPAAAVAPASQTSLYPLPSSAVYPQPCPPPPYNPGPGTKRGKPKVASADLPSARRPLHVHPSLAPIRGKGMWLTTWSDSKVHVSRVVRRAKRAGLTQLWVRTGGTYQGWYGGKLLRRLLPRAHRAGIDVIAWDFPTLSDPVQDAKRARRATQGKFNGERIDGFSADIEQKTEGVFLTKRRVRVYLSRVRRYSKNRPVIATVYRPTNYEWSYYPYKTEAKYVDAFAPMVYWSCDEPGADTRQAVRRLRTLRPVHPIGQAFDMGSFGGRQGLPTGREIWRFVDMAWRKHAVGASLYDWEDVDHQEWKALHYYPWRKH